MIYDCFMFYNELMLLEIRLNELDAFVDKFVLVESTHSHSGEEKPLYYDQVKDNEIFGKFRDKIIHIVHPMESRPNRWHNENAQRNAIEKGIYGAAPDDVIIVSDVDEIINTEVFPKINFCPLPSRLNMKNYYYYFNCRSVRDWNSPSFCRFKDYSSAQFLRRGNLRKFTIKDAGWHFGYLMSPEQIAMKLEAFAHSEFDTDYYKDIDRIQKCMNSNSDLFEKIDSSYFIEPLDAPKYVMNNIDKYQEFIITDF